MSSHNVKVDFGAQGRGKRCHSRAVGNAKAAGPQEFGPLKGSMTGPAYGIRSAAVLAYHARTPQQQVAWRNGVIARARTLGIIKSEDPFKEAKRLRELAEGLTGPVRQDTLASAAAIEARPDEGMPLESCLAFAALAARLPEAHLLDFCLRNKGSHFAAECYIEASQEKWNVVRWTTKEEDALLVSPAQLLARGAALPGLMGKVAAELAAAAAAKPVMSVAVAAAPTTTVAPKAPVSMRVKLLWTRRVFAHFHPKWTAAWWDLQGDHSLPEQARSHCYHMREEAEDNLDHAKRYFPADVAAHAQLAEAAQRACDLEVLASRCPTVVAVLQWGRGSLTHPAVAARKKVQQKKRRLNGKERAAAEKAAAAAIRALPTYITALAPEAYMQPKEQIRSLNFKNLPLATNEAERSALGKALAKLVESAGASVSRERYALNIPTLKFGPAKGHTQGFGFVECTAAAGAQRVLATAGARGTLDLEFNGTTSQVFVELAAANRQSKADWEATKAKATAERAAAQAKTLALMKAAVGPKATPMELVTAPAAPVLAKVCLGATVKARREAEEAAEAARLRAEVEAMFSAPLGGILHSKPKALQFKLSFAGAAVKPAAPKVEVVDAFTAKVGGKLVKVAAAADTELGAAQAMMRKIMAESDAKAKKAARDKAYTQWLKDKAEADADPLGWGIEDWVEPA